jgi:hypothetical protein
MGGVVTVVALGAWRLRVDLDRARQRATGGPESGDGPDSGARARQRRPGGWIGRRATGGPGSGPTAARWNNPRYRYIPQFLEFRLTIARARLYFL